MTTAPAPGSFEVLPGDPASGVVVHVPHASTYIPDEVRAGIVLDDRELADELAAITDAHTDEIAETAATLARRRPWLFVNRASRLVVDPERFPDDREELNSIGMGAVYERTTQSRVLRTPSPAERELLIERFFTPYAEGIAALVRDRLEAPGAVTIIDLHSYPREALPYELHGEGPRPEVCVGTDRFHTPSRLRDLAVSAMQLVAPGAGVGLDSPFSGAYVPLDQYAVESGVHAVMLEIRRDVVAGRPEVLARAVADLIDAIGARRPDRNS